MGNITFKSKRWYKAKGRFFYCKKMRDSGSTLKEISVVFGVSIPRIRKILSKKYKNVPYKETRDVYAEFKAHYDEAMGT